MGTGQIRIEVYTVGQLNEELRAKDFWLQNLTPITKHRAQLLVNNPRSENDDPVLFIAREGNETVGYRVVFPDWIYLEDEKVRIGWGSSFWVSEKCRGKGIGRMLFEKSYEVWDGNIGSLIQSADASRIYRANPNFYCFKETDGYQFILKLNLTFWTRKKLKVPLVLGWLLSAACMPANSIMVALQHIWSSRRKPARGLSLEYCRRIDDPETIGFVERHNRDTLSRKGIADLNTIVEYPTSLPTPLEDRIASRYYFATTATRFDYLYVKIYDHKMELTGLMLMNIEGRGLKLLYYFYVSETVMNRLFEIFLQHAVRLGTEIITSFDTTLNDYLLRRSGFPFLLRRKQVRRSFLPNHLKLPNPGEYKIFDGDGA